MLNLTADENVDAPIVDALRKVGHQVSYVREMDPGIEDTQVLALANEGRSLLLTADKDFGELVYRQGLVHGGVILYRLAGLSADNKTKILRRVLEHHAGELAGAFTLITPIQVRIRRAST